MLVKQDSSAWSTGTSSDSGSTSFVQVIPTGVTVAAVGNYYSIVLKRDCSVWTTAKDSRGRLCFFDGSTTSKGTFSFMQVIPGAKAVVAGSYHSMVLTEGGGVWNAGWNKYGQLGDGSKTDKTKCFAIVSTGLKAVALAAGEIHSIVLNEDGSVWAAGQNSYGQLGDGSKTDRERFVKAVSSGAVDVAAGSYHSMALMQDGSVWATGWNEYGQLGDASTIDRMNYEQVVSSGAKAIAAGSRHSMILKQDGSVWTTGYNLYGQLGNEFRTDSDIFAQVISEAELIAAGAFHSMVIKRNGSIWAAGSNKYGQFGDGSTNSQNKFVRLAVFEKGLRTRYYISRILSPLLLSYTALFILFVHFLIV